MSKIVAILLLCVSVCLYMTNTVNPTIENFNTHFPSGNANAYGPGSSDDPNRDVDGYRFYSNASLGRNSARGADAIACTGRVQSDCNGNPSCVFTNQGCKNKFDVPHESFSQNFERNLATPGGGGATWARQSKARGGPAPAGPPVGPDDDDDNDDNQGVVKPFTTSIETNVNIRSNNMEGSQQVGRCLSTCLGRSEIPITSDGPKGWFEVSKTKLRSVNDINPAHEDFGGN